MSSEGEIRKIAVSLGKTLPAAEFYKDAIQPAAQEVGKAGGMAASLLSTALRPIKTIQLAINTLSDRLDSALEERLRGVPQDQIVEPPAVILGGVLSGAVYLQEIPELRDMFVQLLATSMQRDKQALAHPSFAAVIKELTPVEARLLTEFKQRVALPVVVVRAHPRVAEKENSGIHVPSRQLRIEDMRVLFEEDEYIETPHTGHLFITGLEEQEGTIENHILVAELENLRRLGLIELIEQEHLTDDASYLPVMSSSAMRHIAKDLVRTGSVPTYHKGIARRTMYGKQFLEACLGETA